MRKPIQLPMQDQNGQPAGSMFMMPAREGACETCATAHEPHLPHNAQSIFYSIRFQAEHGRAPTWIDAMAHCSDEMRALWTKALTDRGVDVAGGKIVAARESN